MINHWQRLMAEGAFELRQQRYTEAATYLQEALQDAHVQRRIDNICAAKSQLAKCMCLMGREDEGERLFLETLAVEREHYQELKNYPPQAINGLIELYEKQKRIKDLEEIMIAQVEHKRNVFGLESKAYCSASLLFANVCMRVLNQPGKAIALYQMGLNFIRREGDPLALRIVLLNFEQILRSAGYEEEADAKRLELLKLSETSPSNRAPTYLDFRRIDYKCGRISPEQFRAEILIAIGGTAVNESPMLEEFNKMRRKLGESPREATPESHWREQFSDLIAEFLITEEEVYDAARMLIKEMEESIIESL